MAKHRIRKTVSPAVARAEAWFGVTHAVPSRGTKAHAAMMRKWAATHRVRKNPWNSKRKAWVTKEGAVRHPQNCPIPLAASMLAERREQGKRGKKKIARFANCDYRSAEIAMHYKPKGAGKKFSGKIRRGAHRDADWVTHSEKGKHAVDLSFYKHGGAAVSRGSRSVLSRAGKMLDWWPSSR